MTNAEAYKRAGIIPGKSATRSKSPDRLLRAWASRGEAAIVWDVDGNQYIDCLAALGAVSLGYKSFRGSNISGVHSLPHRLEVEAAEAVRKYVAPWGSSVRFTKEGSSATLGAYMIARKVTKRPYVIAMEGAYHGWHEIWDSVVRVPYGSDPNSWGDGLWRRVWKYLGFRTPVMPETIAAVFIEPARWQLTSKDWLRHVRRWCDLNGVLMVYDSMIYGGRFALGGAWDYFGVRADVECYGKAFGNGQSVAFLVGRDAVATWGECISGTYSGDVGGLQAVCDTLQVYVSEPVIDTLWERGRQLQMGLQSIAQETGKFIVEGAPVHQRIRFHEPPAKTAYDYRLGDERPLAKKFREGMAERGVLMLPDAINVMYSHTSAQIDRVLEAVRETVQAL